MSNYSFLSDFKRAIMSRKMFETYCISYTCNSFENEIFIKQAAM